MQLDSIRTDRSGDSPLGEVPAPEVLDGWTAVTVRAPSWATSRERANFALAPLGILEGGRLRGRLVLEPQ
jgi:hypothetical protein